MEVDRDTGRCMEASGGAQRRTEVNRRRTEAHRGDQEAHGGAWRRTEAQPLTFTLISHCTVVKTPKPTSTLS